MGQIRIYDPDVIPMRQLISRLGTAAIQSGLNFSSAGRNDAGDLVFSAGTLVLEGIAPIVVEALSINDRRIITQVAGDSEDCHRVFASLSEFIAALWKVDISAARPVIFSEETTCVSELDFEAQELLSLQMPRFVGELLEKAANPAGEVFLKSIAVRISIGYALSRELAPKGVTLSDKTFVVEPRMDTLVGDRIYFSHSPTDSKTHFGLLRSLESMLKRSRAKR